MKRLTVFAVVAVLGAGCTDRGIMDVSPQQNALPSAKIASPPGAPGLTVMTWNVYYGIDPSPLLYVTDPQDVPTVAAQIWALEERTDFPARAGALARAIALTKPHLIGVQEAALYGIQHSDGSTEQVDFLQILADSLADRGLHYVIAAADATTDITVPVATAVGLDFVHLIDRDAILAREDVLIDHPRQGRFDNFFPIPQLNTGVYEGWASVEATVSGRTYRFVSTHLEIQQFMPLPVLQAQELLDTLQGETLPTILVGDFNSDVYGKVPEKATPSYGLITGAGFVDSWLRPGGSPPGLTCCENDTLSNPLQTFDQRIDFIFTRNMPQVLPAGSLVLARQVVGDQRGDRTASGLWPSDHGGVVATFLVPPVRRGTVVTE